MDGVANFGLPYAEIEKLLYRPDGTPATLLFRSPKGSLHQARLIKDSSRVAEETAAAGLTPLGYTWLLVLEGLFLPLVLVPCAVLLFARKRGQIVPSLLSLAFLLLTGTSFERELPGRVGRAGLP